jgi:hypothetical protein
LEALYSQVRKGLHIHTHNAQGEARKRQEMFTLLMTAGRAVPGKRREAETRGRLLTLLTTASRAVSTFFCASFFSWGTSVFCKMGAERVSREQRESAESREN